jgi:hypothetical protein
MSLNANSYEAPMPLSFVSEIYNRNAIRNIRIEKPCLIEIWIEFR